MSFGDGNSADFFVFLGHFSLGKMLGPDMVMELLVVMVVDEAVEVVRAE